MTASCEGTYNEVSKDNAFIIGNEGDVMYNFRLVLESDNKEDIDAFASIYRIGLGKQICLDDYTEMWNAFYNPIDDSGKILHIRLFISNRDTPFISAAYKGDGRKIVVAGNKLNNVKLYYDYENRELPQTVKQVIETHHSHALDDNEGYTIESQDLITMFGVQCSNATENDKIYAITVADQDGEVMIERLVESPNDLWFDNINKHEITVIVMTTENVNTPIYIGWKERCETTLVCE